MITCVRSTCRSPATAGLAIDPPRREAWLVEWHADAFLLSPVCERHADALTVPAGWLLHDDRQPTHGLFAERSVAAASGQGTVTRLDHRRARRERVVEEPTLFATDETTGDDATGDRAGDTLRNPGGDWIGDPDERHTELLDVDERTPLLARAFRASQAS